MKITALQPQQHDPTRYNLFLDEQFALALDSSLVLTAGLAVGQEIDTAELEHLRQSEQERKLFESALRFLGPRPRSRAEVRRRLLAPRPHPQHTTPKPAPEPALVEQVLDRLERLEMLNDRDFADFWVENRERFSPRSARALRQELQQRGVDRATVDEVSAPDRDEQRALAAGRQRLRALRTLDYVAFRTKLGQFLVRRGFSYGVAQTAIRALWTEVHDDIPDDDAPDAQTQLDDDVANDD